MSHLTIDIQALSKSYGSHQVLNELHFHIDNGIFGLLGDNGAGKTTLMKILATLLRFDRGEVEIFGYSLKKNRMLFVLYWVTCRSILIFSKCNDFGIYELFCGFKRYSR